MKRSTPRNFALVAGAVATAFLAGCANQGVKNPSREAPIASDLRRYLKEFDRNVEVTERMLLDWPI